MYKSKVVLCTSPRDLILKVDCDPWAVSTAGCGAHWSNFGRQISSSSSTGNGVMRKICLVQSCTEQSLGSAPQHYCCCHQTSCAQHHRPGEVPWNICTALLSRVCRMEPGSSPGFVACRGARAFPWGSAAVPESSCCHNKSGHLSQWRWERRCFPDLLAGRSRGFASVLRDAPILSSPKQKVNFTQEGQNTAVLCWISMLCWADDSKSPLQKWPCTPCILLWGWLWESLPQLGCPVKLLAGCWGEYTDL